MKTKSVYVTRMIPESGLALLTGAGLDVKMNPLARQLRREELLEEVPRHDAVICQFPDAIDRDVLQAAAPKCKIIALCAVGFDNVDLPAARELGITVTNTPDVLTAATADLTWALLLATARRLGEAERFVRAGAWRGWECSTSSAPTSMEKPSASSAPVGSAPPSSDGPPASTWRFCTAPETGRRPPKPSVQGESPSLNCCGAATSSRCTFH